MSSHIVQLASGNEVEVPGPVSQVVPDGSRCYVMLDSNPPKAISDNVLCYDEHGTLLWRVEDLFPGQNCTFGSGHVRKDGRLEFWNTDGLWILIDKDTGKGLGFRWDRFGPCGEGENDTFQPIDWRTEPC